jgi:hypothetical protein
MMLLLHTTPSTLQPVLPADCQKRHSVSSCKGNFNNGGEQLWDGKDTDNPAAAVQQLA